MKSLQSEEIGIDSVDSINRHAWAKPSILRAFSKSSAASGWWSDPGEQVALLSIAARCRAVPILDVGVGTGRTTPLFELLSDQYVGIDYTREMVEICRRNYPDMDIRVGDARDLSEFPDNSFGLVAFSFNGIDAVSHEDRARVLSEFHRVLRPDGVLFYSTHNKSGPCYRATPWHSAGPPQQTKGPVAVRLMRFGFSLLANPWHYPRSMWNWWRCLQLVCDGSEWGLSAVEAHDFDLFIHFITLKGIREELRIAGFVPLAVFAAEDGAGIDVSADSAATRYFHVTGECKKDG